MIRDLTRAWGAVLSWPLDDEVLVRRVAHWPSAATRQDGADWLLDVLVAAGGAREESQKRLCDLALEATRTGDRLGGAPGLRFGYTRLLQQVAQTDLNWMEGTF
jgi:hypothetical protein